MTDNTPAPRPAIEQFAHRITVARTALAQASTARDQAIAEARAATAKADKAGEAIAMLETRLATLRRQLADEASR
jgi:hypothetical protein